MPTRTASSPSIGTRRQSDHRDQQPRSVRPPDARRSAVKVLARGPSIGSWVPAGPRRRACAGPERRAAGACGGGGWVGACLARRDRSGARLVRRVAGRRTRRTSRFAEQIVPGVPAGQLVDVAPTTFVRYAQRVSEKALASDTVHVIVERALDTRERWLSSTLSLGANRWRPSLNGRPTRWFGGTRRNAYDARQTVDVAQAIAEQMRTVAEGRGPIRADDGRVLRRPIPPTVHNGATPATETRPRT